MKLGERITIKLGKDALRLTPSLRHALRLERRPGSFASLVREIQDGSLTTICELIRDHDDIPMLETRVLDTGIETFKEPLTAYVLALTGIDPDAPRDDTKPKASVPFNEHLVNLYKIGTGWLGWLPDQTLDATPQEIMLAYEGRLDMLKAIFGGGDKEQEKSDEDLTEKFKTVFADFDRRTKPGA